LRAGGYALVIRHGLTDPSAVDDAPTDPRDCSRQRNLNAAGREQARALGLGIEGLGIPHAVVLVSPYCRARDTAGLAFGNYDPAFELTAFNNTDPTTNINAFQALVSRKPPPGQNYIYVTHVTNIAAVGLPTVVEGTAIVIQPEGGTALTPIAIVAAADWATLK
jgi:phosphohistidine phosphatase SixA